MPATVNNTMFNVLLQSLAEGKIKPFSMLTSVQANIPVQVGDWRGLYRKDGPGVFYVLTFKGESNEPITKELSSTPVEAKMTLLEAAANEWSAVHSKEVVDDGKNQHGQPPANTQT
jgi:hypothetical protein